MEEELERAAYEGNIEFIEKAVAVSKKPDDYFLAQYGSWGGGTNILHLALWNRRAEFIKKCMNILAPQILQKLISQQDDDGWNPLHVVAANNDLEMLRLLLGFYKSYKGPPLVPENPNHPCNKPWLAITSLYDNETPFQKAIKCGYEDTALEILSMDMDLLCKIVDSDGSSPLFLAVRNDMKRLADKILNSSSTYSLSGEYGSTPLHFTPRSSETILRLLLEKHSELIEKVDDNGFNVLHQWAEIGKKWPFNIILEGKFATVRAKMFKILIYKSTEKSNSDSPLHTATRNANSKIDIVQALVEGYQQEITAKDETTNFSFDYPPWKTKNKQGLMPLHLALNLKKEKVALHLLSIDSTLCKIDDDNKNSPLFLAVINGANQVAEIILTSFEGYSTGGKDGSTPLHFIPISDSSGKVMRLLLKKNLELIHVKDDSGCNVLHQWANIGEIWPLKFLLEEKFDDARIKIFGDLIYECDKEENDNPLHIVARSKNVEFVQQLLWGYQEIINDYAKKPEPPWRTKNKNGETPFSIASGLQLDIALSFLSVESTLFKTDVSADLEQIVDHIVNTNNLQWLGSCPDNILRLLLEKHVNFLDVCTDKKLNVLHHWVSLRKVSPLRWLNQGSKFLTARTRVFRDLILQVDTIERQNPLHIAAKFGYSKVADELVTGYNREKRGQDEAPWKMKNINGDTPLHLALNLNKINVVKCLLSINDPSLMDIRNNEGENVLILAIKRDHEPVIRDILCAPDVHLSMDIKQQTVVVAWLRSCSDEILQLALKNNVDFLDAIDNDGSNVLHKWAKDGNVSPLTMISREDLRNARTKVYKELIFKKEEKMGNSPLHIAATTNEETFVKQLVVGYGPFKETEKYKLPWKTKNNIRNKLGESPLFLAVASGLHEVVEAMLMTLEIIPFSMLRNKEEMTVLHLLENVPDSTAKKLLENYWWIINLRDKQGRTPLDMYKENNVSKEIEVLLKNPYKIDKKAFDCFSLCEKEELSIVLSCIDYDFLHNIKLKTYEDYLSLLKSSSVGMLKNYTLESYRTTPLHRALQREDINFAKALLIDDQVERNIKDINGITAMDLLSKLCNQHENWASMCKVIKVNPHLRTRYIQPGTNMDQMRNTLSVVAALIATITFAAGFTLPGGLRGESGNAILATKGSFLVFLLANAYAMCTSMLVLFCLIWSMVSDRDMSYLLVDRSVMILMQSLYATMVTFMSGIYATVAHSCFWVTIVIFVMCGLSGIFAVKTVLHNVFSMLFSNSLQLKVKPSHTEESASTMTNNGSRNASERSNNICKNCFSPVFLKVKRFISMRNQDEKESTCKEERASILQSVGSKNASQRSNKLVQFVLRLLKMKKLVSKGNKDAKDSTQSLEEGKASTSEKDLSEVTS